jgi:TusA-related sulfurtransferase
MMNVEELKALSPDKIVDARGTACPGPLLAAKRAIAEVPMKGVMEVISSDEGTNTDIPRWCAKLKHDFLGTVEEDGYWRLYLRRQK